ncbi:MAG TPA: hypothetical protein VFC29_20030, partial [Candidatus Limnocylindrales bacterium]|nr:hypothetical protein [Candidatus Limnocylindrales bacterium]
MERKTRKSTIIVLLYCIVAAQIATAQCENKTGFAKHFCEVRKGGSGSSGSGLNIPDLDAFKGAALMAEAKKGLALTFNVAPDAVE